MNKHRRTLTVILMFTALFPAACLLADDQETEAAAPETYEVQPGPIKISVELDGIVVAETMHEVRLEPESWENFVVVEAAAYGRQVRKGDVLLRFDAEPLEQAIADLEADGKLAQLAIEQAEQGLPQHEQSLKNDLETAKRTLRIATQDEERFNRVERPVDEESSEWITKSAQFYYDSALEELRQLKKMYEADDLTEETEEFILKRQQFQVDRAKFQLREAGLSREKEAQLSIPREGESKKIAREVAALGLAKAQTAMELGMAEKRFALEKMKHTRARAEDRLDHLRKDRELLVVRAPADGTVYYGRCVNGKWAETASTATKLLSGSKIRPHEVLMTVVDTEDVYVLAEIPQKHRPDTRDGMNAPVSIPAIGPAELRGRIAEISSIPQASGNFAARVNLRSESDDAFPVPGMTCKVRPVAYAKQDALLVPSSAVAKDSWTGEQYVVLVGKDDQSKRRSVKVGRSQDDQIEIVEGLAAGDTILQTVEEGEAS